MSTYVPRTKQARRALQQDTPSTAEPVVLPCGHESNGGPVATAGGRHWLRVLPRLHPPGRDRVSTRHKPANPLRKSDWLVDVISLGQAAELIRRLHYSGSTANTATFRHGLFRREGWPLEPKGAAVWFPPTRGAAAATWPDPERVLGLSRLVLEPDVPTNGASFLLARSVNLIRQSGDWDCLVTYADKWQGHTGAIYLAAGWKFVGETKPERRYVRDGRLVSRKAGHRTFTHAQMIERGAECVGSYSAFKYVKALVATPSLAVVIA